MNALPTFTGDHPTCAKCGHNHASTRYSGLTIHKIDSPVPVDLDLDLDLAGEHLIRRCDRCTYEWKEACSDDRTGTELELFREADAKIRELHVPVECGCVKCGSRKERDLVCGGCGDSSNGWDLPCPTLQALDAVKAARL